MARVVALRRRPAVVDEDELRRAYAAHGGELFRFALRALNDRGAAEDVVQDVFLRAWRASDRYDPSVASLRVWLFAIARNVVIDHARARSSRPFGRVAGEASGVQVDDEAGEGLDQVLSSWVVEEALRRIGDEHRHAIVETYLRGRPPSEVADELGVPAGTVRSRLFYGLKALRVAMDELGVTA